MDTQMKSVMSYDFGSDSLISENQQLKLRVKELEEKLARPPEMDDLQV